MFASRIRLTLGLLALATTAFAQDTTVVQTFTFDSITTRRGWWEFPSLSQSYRKILMVHTLKCDPQTTWDQYPCGEWDYLTYHIVHEHTGVLDSAALQHPYFLVGIAAPDTVRAATQGDAHQHQCWNVSASLDSVTDRTMSTVGIADTTDEQTFIALKRRSQYLYTAAELTTAGLTAGPVHELRYLPSVPGTTGLERITIRMRNTADTAITRFIDEGLLTVLEGGYDADTLAFLLTTPFVWDGTSNVIVDMANEGSGGGTPTSVLASHAQPGTALRETGNDDAVRTNNDFIGIDPAPLATLDDAITITFRAYGDAQLPQNSTFLEAVGADGQRILNIHLPWSNGRVYWDAGSDGGAYDRIDKAASESDYEGSWTDWAFVKNVSTGTMKIYRNGTLWHSATGKTRPLSGIVRMRVASDANGNNAYPGMIDGLNIFSTEVSAATIAAWHDRKTTPAHPDHGALLYSFEMDEGPGTGSGYCTNAVDPNNQAWLMGTVERESRPATALFRNPMDPGTRPVITFGQGNYVVTLDSSLATLPPYDFLPQLTREVFAVNGNSVVPVDTIFERSAGRTYTYAPDGTKLDSAFSGGDLHINDTLDYFGEPFEVVNQHEIGRYITPYGIQLDLGPDGFSWVYDVTDYRHLLHDSVDLSAGNTQELLDLKFLMIEGDAPRPVVNVQHPWGPMASYSYAGLSDDTQLSPVTVALHPQAERWKLRSRLTGHGHNSNDGNYPHCCEWKDNTHYLTANGQAADEWHIWQEIDCANNPVYPQGGTWLGSREGWCPGDLVKDRDSDLTPFVTGDSLTIDYAITPVPPDNLGMGGGNYVINMDLFEYGAASHAVDAEILDVRRPNDSGQRSRENPICNNPVIVVRNNGTSEITSLTLNYQVSGGEPVSHTWEGTLVPDQRTEIPLPVGTPQFWAGDGQDLFDVEITAVNGADADQYADNDHYRTHFELPLIYPENFVVMYKTNNRPGENALYIRDIDGNIVHSRTVHTANTVYRDTLDLASGCYELEFTDAGYDGLSYWADPAAGSGYFRFRSLTNQVLRTFEPEFGYRIHAAFGVGTITGLPKPHAETAITALPNPSSGLFTLTVQGIDGRARIDLMDVNGRLLRSEQVNVDQDRTMNLDLSQEAEGIYLVRFVHGTGTSFLRLVKQ